MNPPPYSPHSSEISSGLAFLTASNTSGLNKFNPNLPPPSHMLVKQIFGYTLLIFYFLISTIISILFVIISAFLQTFQFIEVVLIISANISLCCFFVSAITNPDYLSGKPEISKMKSVWLAAILFFAEIVVAYCNYLSLTEFLLFSIAEVVILICFYFMYFGDDFGNSWLLIFKPWRYRRTILRL